MFVLWVNRARCLCTELCFSAHWICLRLHRGLIAFSVCVCVCACVRVCVCVCVIFVRWYWKCFRVLIYMPASLTDIWNTFSDIFQGFKLFSLHFRNTNYDFIINGVYIENELLMISVKMLKLMPQVNTAHSAAVFDWQPCWLTFHKCSFKLLLLFL